MQGVARVGLFGYDPPMPIGANIQAWRLSRRQSLTGLASKAGLPASTLESIENGEMDPPASLLEALAGALGIPPSWLYGDPRHLELLTDPDAEEAPPANSIDPIVERILLSVGQDRNLFVLVTALIQSGDPRLIRAAEVSLRSLVKQSQQATVPWQSRPPGHFEPPSD